MLAAPSPTPDCAHTRQLHDARPCVNLTAELLPRMTEAMGKDNRSYYLGLSGIGLVARRPTICSFPRPPTIFAWSTRVTDDR
jgi:hypothetical protein